MIKSIHPILIFFFLISQLSAQDGRVYQLKSGDAIRGTLVSETDSTIVLETALGRLTISRDNILEQKVVVVLKSGDVVTGSLIRETEEFIILETALGTLEISTGNIENIEFQTEARNGEIPQIASKIIPEKWYFSEERLMDIWFDPTGFALEKGDFYFSALSWAYGLTDRFQVSTKWVNYFEGDFNLRPKFTVFQSGDLNRQTSFSTGGHIHTSALPDKWEFKQVPVKYYKDMAYPDSFDIRLENRWTRIGSNITFFDDYFDDIDSTESRLWGELFAAYSISNKRRDNQGRINYTFGASVTYYPDEELMPRFYAAVDIDASKNIKIMSEVFYDPYYTSFAARENNTENGANVHFDIGFMTNLLGIPFLGKSENLWIGIHYQMPFVSLYYKF